MKTAKESRTRQSIMQSLLDLLENKKDIQEIKIIDILEKEKIAKGTFYKYFKTKEDLVEQTLSSYMGQANSILNETFLLDSSERSKTKFVTFINLHKKEYRLLPLLYGKRMTDLTLLLKPMEEKRTQNNLPTSLNSLYPLFLTILAKDDDLTTKELNRIIQETIRQKSEEILILKKANGQ